MYKFFVRSFNMRETQIDRISFLQVVGFTLEPRVYVRILLRKLKVHVRCSPTSKYHSCQVHILENRDIPNTRHIEGETVHRSKCIRDRHHVINNVVVGLGLGQRYRGGIDKPTVCHGCSECLVHCRSGPGKPVHDAFTVIQTHVRYVPIFFFLDTTQNRAQGSDIGET